MTTDGSIKRQTPMPIFLRGFDAFAVHLRELSFGLLALTGAPVTPARLADLAGKSPAKVERTLQLLAETGRIDRDGEGRVVGSAGLAIGDGPHSLSFWGRSFTTWCAFDALGIPASLGVDAIVETSCAICGAPIRVEVRGGEPAGLSAARLWMSAGGADMRADFCTPTMLLCSAAHAQTWGARHNWAGDVLSLAEAAEVGNRNWASCAATFVSLRDHHALATHMLMTDAP